MGSKGEVGETCYTSCESSLYDFLTIQKRLAASEATVLRVGTGG